MQQAETKSCVDAVKTYKAATLNVTVSWVNRKAIIHAISNGFDKIPLVNPDQAAQTLNLLRR